MASIPDSIRNAAANKAYVVQTRKPLPAPVDGLAAPRPVAQPAPASDAPLALDEFMANAEPLQVTIAGRPMVAIPKAFQTGSFGWHVTGKVLAVVDGRPVQVQVGLVLTVVGSKGAPREGGR